MTSDEMVRRLQAEFGSLGPITQYAPTAETYAVNPGEQLIAGPNTSYIAGNRRLEPNDRRQNPETGFWNEPSEFITMLRSDPDAQAAENGGGWMGVYDIEGNMVGSPYYQDPQYSWLFDHMDELRTAATIATMIASGIPADPSIGMTAAEAALANAPEFAAANTFSNPSWYEPFAQGFQSIKDLTDVGKFIDGPSWLQQGATSGFRNVLGQAALTGDVDLERALQAAATAGVTGFADPYLSELPKEFQQIAKAGVQTALQGGSAEDVFKGAVGSAILGPINETVAGIAGPTAAKVATSAVRGLLSSGAVNTDKLTVNMLGDFVGSAVAKETGDAFLGKAAATAIRSKGNLEATIKQLAMGALTTPTKKG